jgi:hypothetical protein
MPRFTAPSVLDAALNEIAASTRLTLCSDQPSSFANINTVRLAEAPMTPGDYSIANGTNGARVMTVAAKPGLEPLASGEANHFCLDSGSATITHIGICMPIQIDDSDPERVVNLPSFTITFRGPDA